MTSHNETLALAHREYKTDTLPPQSSIVRRADRLPRPPLETPPLAEESSFAAPTSTLSPNSAAARIVEALVARGVDTYFGVPGGPICPLFEALRIHPSVRVIESRHESHAAFAAVAYHRASGKVPAVVVTAGPGVTNAISGVASAFLEACPVVV